MSTLVSIAFWTFILVYIVKRSKKGAKEQKEARKQTVRRETQPVRRETQAERKPSKKRKSSPGESLFTDRITDPADDWLTRQRREEKKALREVSAMFELKTRHEENCEAEKVRKASRR